MAVDGNIRIVADARFCADDDAAHAGALKALFDRYGSDKGTGHDYHRFYGHVLADGSSVRSLLELRTGFAPGPRRDDLRGKAHELTLVAVSVTSG